MTIEVLDDDRLPWTARCVAGFRAQGYTNTQVSKIMNVHRHTIERAVQTLRAAGVTVGESSEALSHVGTPILVQRPNMVHDMSQNSTSQVPKRDNGHLDPADFDQFWSLYPKKVGKKGALAKFKAARKSATQEQIIAGLKAYREQIRANKTELQFVANPMTWLNQGRWEDEAATKPSVAVKSPVCPRCGTEAMGTMSFCPSCSLDRSEWKTWRKNAK